VGKRETAKKEKQRQAALDFASTRETNVRLPNSQAKYSAPGTISQREIKKALGKIPWVCKKTTQ
jgi:hypothetical protein